MELPCSLSCKIPYLTPLAKGNTEVKQNVCLCVYVCVRVCVCGSGDDQTIKIPVSR